MSIANVIRIAIVASWLVLFGSHALHYALPDLGLQDRHDFAAVVNANLDRSFTYVLVPEPYTQSAHPLGTCTLSLERDESHFLLKTDMQFTDHSFDAMVDVLLPPITAAKHDKRLTLSISESLDEHLHLDTVQAQVNAHGHTITASGKVSDTGLAGTYEIDASGPTPFVLPEITPVTTQGLDVAISLPPGLKPGERFSSHMVNPDLLKLSAHRTVAVFQAKSHETIRTWHGDMNLLRVDMEVDGKPYSSLWCDSRGTVYRSVQNGSRMALMLDSTSDLAHDGRILWPVSP